MLKKAGEFKHNHFSCLREMSASLVANGDKKGVWEEAYMGGRVRLLSFLKLSFLYIGAI